jgi:hypothetical protein
MVAAGIGLFLGHGLAKPRDLSIKLSAREVEPAVIDYLPEGPPLPNLAELLQEKCEKLLEQVCMPVQG